MKEGKKKKSSLLAAIFYQDDSSSISIVSEWGNHDSYIKTCQVNILNEDLKLCN